MSPLLRDPSLELERLRDPVYFEERLRFYRAARGIGEWFVRVHEHTCARCGRVIAHTGLEAARDGDASHQCCGVDVRHAIAAGAL